MSEQPAPSVKMPTSKIKSQKSDFLSRKAASAAIFLGFKRILIQAIFTLSNVILARALYPQDFGTYATILFVVILFAVFTDIGFNASLIQRQGKINSKDLGSAFTFQLVLVLIVIAVINISAPLIGHFYDLGGHGVGLLRLMTIGFLFTPFKSSAGAILERRLEYKKLVTIEVLEVFFTSLTAVLMAVRGYGVTSFVVGYIVGHIVSAILYQAFSPWKIRLSFDFKRLLPHLRFGLHFQTNQISGLFFGPLIILFLSKSVGTQNLGYFQFASGLSVLPIAFSEIVNRIAFPLGSMVQGEEKYFRGIIEKSILVVSATTLPLVFLGLATVPEIIRLVYTDRWLVALPVVYLGFLQMIFVSYNGVFSQMLMAKGEVKTIRNMGVFWAVLTWMLAPVLIRQLGIVGMGITNIIVSVTGLWFWYKLHRQVEFKFLTLITPYLFGSFLSGLLALILIQTLPLSIFSLIISLASGTLAFLIFIIVFDRENVRQSLELVRSVIQKS